MNRRPDRVRTTMTTGVIRQPGLVALPDLDIPTEILEVGREGRKEGEPASTQ
jgi:hypothetical protein